MPRGKTGRKTLLQSDTYNLNGPEDSNDWSIIVVGQSTIGTTVEILDDLTKQSWTSREGNIKLIMIVTFIQSNKQYTINVKAPFIIFPQK